MPIKDYGNGGDGTDDNEQPIIIGERITAFNISSKISAQITNLDDYTLLKKSDYPNGANFRGGKHLEYRIFWKKTAKELTHAHRSDGDYIVVLKTKTTKNNSGRVNGGGTTNIDSNTDSVPYSAGIARESAQETSETTVHIIKPKNNATVERESILMWFFLKLKVQN